MGFHYVFYVFALIFSVSDTIFLKFLGACGAQIPIFLQKLKDFGKSSQKLKVWLPPPHPRGGCSRPKVIFIPGSLSSGSPMINSPLKIRIWEFSFRGLNCAKRNFDKIVIFYPKLSQFFSGALRAPASGVLIVPRIQQMFQPGSYRGGG